MALILFIIIFIGFIMLLNRYLKDKILNCVFSFGLTIFYINLLLVAISYIFGDINKNIFIITTFIFSGTLVFMNFKEIKLDYKVFKLDKLEITVLGIIAVAFILNIFINVYWGIFSWDALATYDLRARYFHDINKLTTIMPDEGVYFGVFKYPVLTTNIHLFFYLFNPDIPTIIYSLFLLFFSIGMGRILYIMTCNRKYAILLGTFLFFINPVIIEQSLIAYNNVPFAFFYFFSTMALFLYYKEKQYKWLILSAVFLGISFWLRMEAFAFYIVNIVIILLFKKEYKIKNLFLYSIITLSVGLIWYAIIFFENKIIHNVVYKFFYLGGRGDAIQNVKSFHISNMMIIIKDFFQFIFINKPVFNFLWYIFIFFLFYKGRDNLNFNSMFLIMAIGLNVIMWGVVWFFAYSEETMRLSGLRTIINFYPLVFLFVIYKFIKMLRI